MTSSSTSTTTTSLNANSVMRDYMSEYFKLNEAIFNRLLNSNDVGGNVDLANEIFCNEYI